jgi:CDP-diacylglycerol--glycerol-3-phosphate 3-phosphatidyltransferase
MDLWRFTILPEPLKKAFLELIDPIADRLIEAGLTPNRITTISTFLIIASGAAFALGALERGALHVAGAFLLLSGLFDLLDGKVARRGGMSTRFGAFYDSSMDRLGEGVLFTGIAIFYMASAIMSFGNRMPALALFLCFACLIGSFLVSYTRARAEGLGIEAKVGMAQRAERIVFLGGPTLFFGAGKHGWMLLIILAWLTLISWITVVQRIYHVYRVTRNDLPLAAVPPAAPAPVTPPAANAPAPVAPPRVVPQPAVKGT